REVELAARLQVGASELALGNAVAVEIRPPHRSGRYQLQRVVALREASGSRLLISPDGELEGSLLVAKEVVDHAATRRNAVPLRELDRPKGPRGRKAAGRRRLDRDAAREVFHASPVVDGEAVQGPGILREEGGIGMEQVVVLDGRVQDRGRRGDAVL